MTPTLARRPVRRWLLALAVLMTLIAGGVLGAAAQAQAAPSATSTTAPTPAPSNPFVVAPSPGLLPLPTAPPSGAISRAPGIGVGPSLPEPAPTSGAGGAPPTSGGGGGCGFFDVTCHISSAIDSWFRELVTSALNPILGLLGRTVLATPDVTGGQVGAVWGLVAGIANALVVLLVLAGGALVMGHETLQTRYAAKDVAPRIVVAVIAANASLALVRLAIPAVNAVSAALLGPGVDPASATAAMRQLVTGSLASGGTFLVLLGLVAAVLAVVLLLTWIGRVAVLVLLVAAAPLALVCHALPHTDGAARLWWRALAGVLGIQLAQSLVLVCALKVFFAPTFSGGLGLGGSSGLVDVLVAICLLWLLVRIPAWASRIVFAGSRRGSGVGRVVKMAVVYKLIRAGVAALA